MPKDEKAVECVHRCECQHQRVRYCPTCKVVHCLDCREEWWSAPRGTRYWNYPNYWYSNGTVLCGGATTTSTASGTAYQVSETGCTHGGENDAE